MIIRIHKSLMLWEQVLIPSNQKRKMIKTKYVLFSGDDDFYIVKSLSKMIRNLKNSSEFIGITGKALQIETGGTQ